MKKRIRILNDSFVGEFEECVETLQEAGLLVTVDVLLDSRSYGYTKRWILGYAECLENIFTNNGKEG